MKNDTVPSFTLLKQANKRISFCIQEIKKKKKILNKELCNIKGTECYET